MLLNITIQIICIFIYLSIHNFNAFKHYNTNNAYAYVIHLFIKIYRFIHFCVVKINS